MECGEAGVLPRVVREGADVGSGRGSRQGLGSGWARGELCGGGQSHAALASRERGRHVGGGWTQGAPKTTLLLCRKVVNRI